MPKWNDLPPDVKDAVEKLHAFVQEHSNVFGPKNEWETDDDLPDAEREVLKKPVFLNHWVLASSWMDDNGEEWSMLIMSPRCPTTTADGLLYWALNL